MNNSAGKRINSGSRLNLTGKRLDAMDFIAPSKLEGRNTKLLEHAPVELLKVFPDRSHSEKKLSETQKSDLKGGDCCSKLKRSSSDEKNFSKKELLASRRKRVRSLISERLRNHPNKTKANVVGGNYDEDNIKQAAVAIETLLFRHRRNLFEDEANFEEENRKGEDMSENLRTDLRYLMGLIIQRRAQMEDRVPDRLDIIRKAVGDDNVFEQICVAVDQIKTMRLNLGGVPLFGGKKMMLAARNVFFNTALSSAYDFAPMDTLSCLPWKDMLKQAEQNIADYKIAIEKE